MAASTTRERGKSRIVGASEHKKGMLAAGKILPKRIAGNKALDILPASGELVQIDFDTSPEVRPAHPPERDIIQEGIAMWNVFVHHLSFAPDAVVGVSLIGIYFVWMVGMAMMRIRKGDHLHH